MNVVVEVLREERRSYLVFNSRSLEHAEKEALQIDSSKIESSKIRRLSGVQKDVFVTWSRPVQIDADGRVVEEVR